jgi:toxin ParE1/3/4
MTGRINYTPEAEQQLHDLDESITQAASAEIARGYVSAVMNHIETIVVFPLAGRARDDVRVGMRTTIYRKRTVVAYEVDESTDEVVINILGVFHGGQDWEATLRADPSGLQES